MPPVRPFVQFLKSLLAPATEEGAQLAFRGPGFASTTKIADPTMEALISRLAEITPEKTGIPAMKTKQLPLLVGERAPRTGPEVSRQSAVRELVGPDLAPAVDKAIGDVLSISKKQWSVGRKMEPSKTTGPGQAQEMVPVEKLISPEDLEQGAYELILKRGRRGELPTTSGELYTYLYPKLRKMAGFEIKGMIEPVTTPSAESIYAGVSKRLEKILGREPTEEAVMGWLRRRAPEKHFRAPKSFGEVAEAKPRKVELAEELAAPEDFGLSPEQVEKLGAVKNALGQLPERKRSMVSMLLGLEGEPMSQVAVAKALGIKQHSVSEAYQAALSKIRKNLGIAPKEEQAVFTPEDLESIRLALRRSISPTTPESFSRFFQKPPKPKGERTVPTPSITPEAEQFVVQPSTLTPQPMTGRLRIEAPQRMAPPTSTPQTLAELRSMLSRMGRTPKTGQANKFRKETFSERMRKEK